MTEPKVVQSSRIKYYIHKGTLHGTFKRLDKKYINIAKTLYNSLVALHYRAVRDFFSAEIRLYNLSKCFLIIALYNVMSQSFNRAKQTASILDCRKIFNCLNCNATKLLQIYAK